MGLDIKIPIGLLFTVIGLLLLIFGIFTNSDAILYEKSLQININLWIGLVMVIFGGLMLVFSKKSQIKEITEAIEHKEEE
ncbi:MAG: hypothetical protein JXB17_08875 [Bacteroidales bacterium]|nr:hypothetical protein [Bacteroidales bacterium]